MTREEAYAEILRAFPAMTLAAVAELTPAQIQWHLDQADQVDSRRDRLTFASYEEYARWRTRS